MVKTAIASLKYKGTSYAVKNVVAIVLSEANITEWYEYGGDPGYFRINMLNNPMISDEKLKAVVTAINTAKNVRSWLDEIRFIRKPKVIKNVFIPSCICKEITIGLPEFTAPNVTVIRNKVVPVNIFKEINLKEAKHG